MISTYILRLFGVSTPFFTDFEIFWNLDPR